MEFHRLAPVAAGLLAGCNGMFYHPDHVDYGSPRDDGHAYRTEVWITHDGVRLQAWTVTPPGTPVGSVLQFHGNAQNRTSHFGFVEWLVDRGYEVVTFDYRGYDGSTGVPSRPGLYVDGATALRHFCDEHPGPRFLLAQSLGGAVLVPTLADFEAQDCFSAVVIESSFSSYREMADAAVVTMGLPGALRYLVDDIRSPKAAAGRVHIPALVIHGDADNVVPFAQGQRLFAALGSRDKTWVPLAGAPHTPAFKDGLDDVVLHFFEDHGSR